MRKDIQINVDTKTSQVHKDNDDLGITSENLQGKIIFKPEPFVDGACRMYIEGRGSILMEKEDDCYTLDILSSLLTEPYIDVCFKITEPENEKGIPVFCSKKINFKVLETIDSSSTIPEDYPSWEQILDSKIAELEALEEEVVEAVENIEDLTADYNQNAIDKTDAFNQNAISKTNAFDNHVTLKTEDFDADTDDIVGTKKAELDDYEKTKENELDTYTNRLKNDLDSYESTKETELNSYTGTKKTELNTHTNSKKTELDTYEGTKETELNTYANGLKNDFNQNATNKTNAYNTNHTEKMTEYNNNATSKVSDYNTNATNKTSEFNQNATNKTNDFNDNATAKIAEYDEHVAELQGEIDDLNTLVDTELNTNVVEGTTLDVSDSAEYRGRIDVKGNTEQEQLSGKNLYNYYSYPNNNTSNGVTITNNRDGSFTLNGTCTQNNTRFILGNDVYIGNLVNEGNVTQTAYYISGSCVKAQSSSSARTVIRLNYDTGTDKMIPLENLETALTISKVNPQNDRTTSWSWGIVLGEGDSFNNFTIKYQIEKGTEGTDWEPYCGGQASPNPDYPQEIKVVTGNNVVKHVGKNLWGGFTPYSVKSYDINYVTNADGTVIANGTSTGYATSVTIANALQRGIYKKLPAGTYSVSGGKSSKRFVSIYDSNATQIGRDIGNGRTFTLSEDTTIILRAEITSGETADNEIFYIQIEEGTTPTPYEPYREEEYEVNLGGDNLLVYPYQDTDKESRGITWDVNDDGTILVNGTNNDSSASYFNLHYANDTLQLKAGTYTFSLNSSSNVRCTISNYTTGTDIATIRANNSQVTFTLDEDTTIRIILAVSSGLSVNNVLIKPMLNKGTVAKRFAPYTTYQLELCKIGEYQDYLYKENGNWYKYNAINKYVYNDDLTSNTITENKLQMLTPTLNITGGLANSQLNQIAYCNMMKATEVSYTGLAGTTSSNKIRISISTSYVSDYTEFRALCASKNLTIYYATNSPTTTQITDTTLISQLEALRKAKWFKGVNHWWTETENLVPYIKGTYKQSNNLKIKEQDERLDNLESRLALLE